MILHIKDVKDICSKISIALDSSEGTAVSSAIELVTNGTTLFVNVANSEYSVQYKFTLDTPTAFHATVQAETFLKLMQMITTETVELSVSDNLIIRGNGQYTLPLLYQGDSILELPLITTDNTETEFDIDTALLNSINDYNAKELTKGLISSPLHRLFYVDNFGAITHTAYGACVNSFSVPTQFTAVFGQKIVKLFKLFDTTPVHITLSKKETDGGIERKIVLESSTIKVVAIVSSDDSNLINFTSRATKIRNIATKPYPNSVTIDKDKMLQALNRLSIFKSSSINNDKVLIGTFKFDNASVTIADVTGKSYETVVYASNTNTFTQGDVYTNKLDLNVVKSVLETCGDGEVKVYFGDHQSITVVHNNIVNVIQERR